MAGAAQLKASYGETGRAEVIGRFLVGPAQHSARTPIGMLAAPLFVVLAVVPLLIVSSL